MNTHRRNRVIIIFVLLAAIFVLAACNTAEIIENGIPASMNQGNNTVMTQNSGQAAATTAVTTSGEWSADSFYSGTCAACHGTQGQGSPIAPPLTSETVQTADRSWLVETISNGRTGTAMPAWSVQVGGVLNSDQIEAMADFVQAKGWQNAPVAQAENNAPALTTASNGTAVSPQAISLFATTCSGCHGANGQGSNIAPPLNSAELRGRLDDAALTSTITNGRFGTQMPAWGNTLSPTEIASLVTLVRNWDGLNGDQLAQLSQQAAECGNSMGGGMMGRGNGMGGGMMGRGNGMGGGMMGRSNANNC